MGGGDVGERVGGRCTDGGTVYCDSSGVVVSIWSDGEGFGGSTVHRDSTRRDGSVRRLGDGDPVGDCLSRGHGECGWRGIYETT